MEYKWSKYQDFILYKIFTVEEECGELKLYNFFDALAWGYRYAIVLNDNILIISEDYPWDFWYGAEAVYRLMNGMGGNI